MLDICVFVCMCIWCMVSFSVLWGNISSWYLRFVVTVVTMLACWLVHWGCCWPNTVIVPAIRLTATICCTSPAAPLLAEYGRLADEYDAILSGHSFQVCTSHNYCLTTSLLYSGSKNFYCSQGVFLPWMVLIPQSILSF